MFYPSYLGARLGSGLYQPPQEASIGMLGSGMYTPQAQGIVPRRRGLPQMPLGSGMFDATQPDDQQFSPHPLGSGLFGQPSLTSMAQQNPQAPAPQQPQQQQLAPVVDKSTVAQPQAQPSAEDKFSALLNNPMFQFGMNLLGSSTSPNPWGPALQNTLAGMAQSAAAKRADAQAKAEQRRVDIEQQLANYKGQSTGYEGDRVGIERQRAGYEGQHIGNESRGIDIEQQRANQQAPLTEAQTGLATAQTARSGAETRMDQQKMDLAMQQYQQQQRFLQQISPMLLGAPQSGAGGQQPMSLPQGTAGGGVGKYGTPNSLLDGIQHVESGGNPNAVNPQSGATGAFQFMPATVDMLAKQGIRFDPRDPQQSRDAADYYMNMLTQQHGGDTNAALAAYGGFKTKDPSGYINKVMTAANNGMPPTQQTGITPQNAPQPPQAPTADAGINMARAGTLAAMGGLHGGEQMVELGKMMQPQPTAAGSYLRDPSSGQMTFMPNPYEAARTQNDTTRTSNEVAKTGSELTQTATKRAETQAADTRALRSTNGSLDRLSQNVDQLLKHPGLESNTGWHSTLGLNKIPNSQGKDASVLLESLKSKMMVGTIAELKAMSKNGSTGFGQLSDREGQVAETLVSNLDRAQTFDSMKKALGDIKQFADEAKTAHAEYYNSMYGQGGPGVSALGPQSAPAPKGAQPAPAASGGGDAIPLADYLKSRRGGMAVSPRERVGVIR